MKFKYVIGLDIGTNSLGWCLLKEFEDGSIEIIKTGVHIFPIGTIVDDKSNKEKTKNEQRRSYRGASRMRYRFKLRRGNLKDALDKLGMLPDYSKLLRPLTKKEKKDVSNFKRAQSYELYKLRADTINPNIKIPLQEIGRIFMLLNKYRGFKSNSKKLANDDKEAGEVKKGCEQLQGLIDKSGSQTIGEYFFKMHEKARQWYEENKWHNFNEPIDERAYNEESGEFILFNSNGIRRNHGRYTLRDMYLSEFDKIWAAQKCHYPEIFSGSKTEYDEIMNKSYRERISALKEFKKTNYWHIREYCIYYQRPLKSQKKYVSNCQFERGLFVISDFAETSGTTEKTKQKRIWKKKAKKACHRSNPLFQEFRIWQKLHQISYNSVEEDGNPSALKSEWLACIADYLSYNENLNLSKPSRSKVETTYWIGKLLQDKGFIKDSSEYNFFIDKSDEDVDGDDKNENRINGNQTYANFYTALGESTFNRLKNETITRQEQVNESTSITISEDKLFLLWKTIYQAKDGLFKEDDWLKCILTEPTKWNFTEEQAKKLIESGLQPDYGSYSAKVLKAILPHMRNGLNEHKALKAVDKGYVNDDNTIGTKVQLKEKISQLTYQELRNPVVERALSKTIRLVNALLEKYKEEIDRNNFEIRIESTRQFRKPRQERENERRKNTDKDKLRLQYAAFLTKNKDKLGFKRDIYKYDSIVNKYELWLQMNMNEDDEMFKNEFKAFSKISKHEDRIKHKLWLECGRRCPYTERIINFTDCFSSEVEIEHIIPLSRSLDDSFNNKTLTFRSINAEKGSMTPLEYLEKKGGDAVKAFKARMNGKYHDFSDSKKKLFLTDKIEMEFSNNQISNASYIAKYTRDKMREVCKNVQFTNGSATAELRNYDWGLSNLLDKIRYKEDHGINIDEYFREYYRIKREFVDWLKKKKRTSDVKIEWNNLTGNEDLIEYIKTTNNDLLYWLDGIDKFNEFRNKSGKKDRSDHRHHAIDAFITACCSPKIIKELSTFNATREQRHLRERERIEKTFDYDNLKESIENILVSHSEKQALVKKRKNRIKTNNGVIEHVTYAPQGKLHEESFYAKRNGATVRRVELFDDLRQDKNLFNSESDLNYVVKGKVKWSYIPDRELHELAKQRLTQLKSKAFSKDSMENQPFFRTSPKTPNNFTSKKNKQLPIIKSVRKRFNIDRSLINLPAKNKNEEDKILFTNRYADNESNALIALYQKQIFDKKGNNKKPERDFDIVSFYESVESKNPDNKTLFSGSFFPDEKDGLGLNPECKWLKAGDLIALYIDENDKESLEWSRNDILKDRIFIVKGISSSIVVTNNVEYEFGYVSLLKNRISKPDSYSSEKDISECIKLKSFKLSHIKLNAIKVRLNILGDIIAKGSECFESNR